MHGDENWVHRPESAFSKKAQFTVVIIVSVLVIGAAAGIYFLWHYINY